MTIIKYENSNIALKYNYLVNSETFEDKSSFDIHLKKKFKLKNNKKLKLFLQEGFSSGNLRFRI